MSKVVLLLFLVVAVAAIVEGEKYINRFAMVEDDETQKSMNNFRDNLPEESAEREDLKYMRLKLDDSSSSSEEDKPKRNKSLYLIRGTRSLKTNLKEDPKFARFKQDLSSSSSSSSSSEEDKPKPNKDSTRPKRDASSSSSSSSSSSEEDKNDIKKN